MIFREEAYKAGYKIKGREFIKSIFKKAETEIQSLLIALQFTKY